MMGLRQRRRIRRRRLKAILLPALLTFLILVSSWMIRAVEPIYQDERGASFLKYAQNLCAMTGPVGEAKIYIDRWPQYADYIIATWREAHPDAETN